MKKAKAFLARVLTAAVMITSLLPGTGMTANAATIQTTANGWKVERNNSNWSGSFDDALNLGGVQTWRLRSADTTGSANGHGDLTSSDAAMTVYANALDITAPEQNNEENTAKHRKISFDIYPKGTASAMRFGILLKYVDATHYVYLGNHSNNHWFLEWGPGITYTVGEDKHRYTDKIEALEAFSLEDFKFHRITIEYLNSSEIQITMQKMKEQPIEGSDEETKWVVDETQDAVTTTLNNAAIHEVKEYAVSGQSPGNYKPIRFGFLGGTYKGTRTDVDIANVQANIENIDEMTSWRYGYCDWTSPRTGDNVEEILEVTSVGGVNYRSINALTSETPKTLYNTMDELQDFSEGTVSAVLRPYLDLETPGNAEREFYLNTRVVTAESPNPAPIKVGYNGTSWGYQIGSESFVEVEGEKPQRRHDYKVDVTFEDNKFSAKVVEVEGAGDENDEAADYLTNDYSKVVGDEIIIADKADLSGKSVAESGSISITAGAQLNVRVRNVNYSKVTGGTEFEDWEDACKTIYSTVMGRTNTDPVVYYKDSWEAFDAARASQSAKLTGEGVITEQGARNIVNEMNAAWTEFDVAANKIETGKQALEAARDDLAEKSDQDYYQADDWTAIAAANTAITDLLTKINENPADVTSTEVESALNAYDAVKDSVTPKPSDAADQTKIAAALAKEIPSGESKYYDEEAWGAYAAAIQAVKDLNKDSSKIAVKNALDALAAAAEELAKSESLKAATADEIAAAATKISNIEKAVNGNYTPDQTYTNALAAAKKLVAAGAAPTLKDLDNAVAALETAQKALKPIKKGPSVTAGQVVSSGKMDYTVTDVAAKTVVLKEGKDVKQKKVTIPATIMIGTDSYKVVGIAANAFKNYKNIKNITIGANVASIEKKAFPNCAKLTKVTFKTSKVTLKKNAFVKAKKTVKVKVPKSLKKDKKFVKSLKKAGLKKYKL